MRGEESDQQKDFLHCAIRDKFLTSNFGLNIKDIWSAGTLASPVIFLPVTT